MRRSPPSTIYRYLPSTQIIQTHNSHSHNANLPDFWTRPSLTVHLQPHTTSTKKQTHVLHYPISTGLVSPIPILLSTRPLTSQTVMSQAHTHFTNHTPRIPNTLAALDTIPEPHTHAPNSTQPHLTRLPKQHCRHTRTLNIFASTQTTAHV